jgi:hypothetical protein
VPEINRRIDLLSGISVLEPAIIQRLKDELSSALHLAELYVAGTAILRAREQCLVSGGGQAVPRTATVVSHNAAAQQYTVRYDGSDEEEVVVEGRVERTILDVLNYSWQRRVEIPTWYKVRRRRE